MGGNHSHRLDHVISFPTTSYLLNLDVYISRNLKSKSGSDSKSLNLSLYFFSLIGNRQHGGKLTGRPIGRIPVQTKEKKGS
jgi:hypothetical protein